MSWSVYPIEIRVLAASGMLGTGFPEESLHKGLAMRPHFIGVDAGSTDSGPTDLATGTCRYSEAAYRRDLKLLLSAAVENNIPLIIGSAGGAGGDKNVDWAKGLIEDLISQLNLSLKMAVIYSGQDKEWLKQKLAAGKIQLLENAPELTDAVIDESITIVGMMGSEPIVEALRNGAQVVLAGRATDTSIFASFPIMNGAHEGSAWHAAKILECGAAAVEHRPSPDCMFATLQGESFIIQAPNEALRCTPTSVAAHSLYENADPYKIIEPSGILNTTDSVYEAVNDKVVKVTGSKFEKSEKFTIKLEGTRLAGYQTIVVAGIRDPLILESLDKFLESCESSIKKRIKNTYPDLSEDDWKVHFRVYGRNGVMEKREPTPVIGHEIGLMIEVTAQNQKMASSIASVARHQTLHVSVPGWFGFTSNIALPYGANDLVRGPVYEFNINAVVEPDPTDEMFKTFYFDYPKVESGVK